MKDRKTYLKLLAWGGWLGLHKFYLLKYRQGIGYMLTLGLFGFGWIYDLLHANEAVDQYNASRGFINAAIRDDRSR